MVVRSKILWLMLALVLTATTLVSAEEDDEASVEAETPENIEEEEEIEEVVYGTPAQPVDSYLAETFDDVNAFEKTWVRSKAKKDGVDEGIAKYDGVWAVESAVKEALIGDRGLVLKSKAKHAAISIPLKKTFEFNKKPLVVQYEVNLQNGQDCGGAYIKLLSAKNGKVDLENFTDKTPYTIMFGPDKCGNDFKLHFIFRHVNPLTGEIEEKHAKRPRDKFEEAFKDKKPHLYTLIIRHDNNYEVLLDHSPVNTGNLLEDFTPPVNPPKEIADENDKMPEDWDEREKIPDPNAKKPDEWDDDAPMQIADPDATMPRGWLNNQPEMIADPEAIKPDDWDDEMDGEWEAPLINNPICSEAPGCGEWSAPMVENPAYKGKWKAPMIDNPNYRGKWAPRRIQNPGYFEDLQPYKMTPIGAVGLELWSMSDNIYFDNLLITDSVPEAYAFAAETFDLKVQKIEKGNTGTFQRILNYSNKNPWLYGIYVLLVAIPVVLIFACCCAEISESQKAKDARKKKTDEMSEDDPQAEEEGDEEAPEEGEAQEEEEGEAQEEEDEPQEVEVEDDEEEEDDEEVEGDEGSELIPRKSPRLRKPRKD
ncbi:unnamed protein product, partial [Meganyctiphanes norvegica]